MESIFSKDILTYKKKIIFNAGNEATIEYTDNKNNFTPQIQLLFSPFGLPFVPMEIVGTNANKIISSLSWTKDRDNPGGLLAMEFVPDAEIVKKMVDIINKYSKNIYSMIWGELGVELEDLFKCMTLCQLWINGYHLMTGTVRSCIKNTVVSNDGKNCSYSLVIDELGNLYNQATISNDLIVQDLLSKQIIDSIKKPLEMVSNIKGVTIAMGIQAILNAFSLTSLMQFQHYSDGIPASMRLFATPNPIGAIANLSIGQFMTVDANMFQTHSSGSGQANIWSFLKNFIPNPWMEFYTESGGRTIVTESFGVPAVLFPGLNYVVARTVPYSNPLLGVVNPAHILQTSVFELNALSMLMYGDFIIITDDMIQEKHIGFDCVNQHTVFHCNYTSGGVLSAPNLANKGLKCPGALNPISSGGIPTFGIREMFQNVDATSFYNLGSVASMGERIAINILGAPGIVSQNALSNLLAVWFRNQSRFREGSITTRCIPYARPGMYCLYLPSLNKKKHVDNIRDIGIYYINSLTHNYGLSNEGVNFTTTLNLIRGVPLPMSVAHLALLLFDFEVFPPASGFFDGEYEVSKLARAAIYATPLAASVLQKKL